jgi:ABC-type multidrug transport system fused ATPase/permease subunit
LTDKSKYLQGNNDKSADNKLVTVDKTSETPSSKEEKDAADVDELHKDKRQAKLITVEERNMGDVEFSTYTYYIKAGGTFIFSLVILALLGFQAATVCAQFQLAYWGDLTARKKNQGGELSDRENLVQLQTYAWISMIGIGCVTVRAVTLANHRIGTSIKLHKSVLERIMNAPVAFFDVTPIGRILNRFSSDLQVIDEDLSQTISQLSNSFFQCVGAIGAVAGATKGTFLILLVNNEFVF